MLRLLRVGAAGPLRAMPVLGMVLAGAAAPARASASDGPRLASAKAVSEAPVIDGRVNDAAWAGAPVVEDFRQRDPREGEAATEPTRVRIVYDRTHLYIAAELDDREPALVRASELRRDNSLDSDDSFAVLLDTYLDHRNAFLFRVNPRGTRFDGLIRNESRIVDATWDEDWQAAAALGDHGWAVELAIPFKILRFREVSEQEWGINFERIIKRKNELTYWAGWSRDYVFAHVSQAGRLTDLAGITQAERLRIRPYVTAGVERYDAATPPAPSTGLGGVGIDDVKFAVTPNLTVDAAVNPDFAQTEVDAQRVNLTRFSLFYPERRQFFIEGADSLKMGVDTLGFGARLMEVVYTRSIGLSPQGTPIPILVGSKLTGKAGGFDLGLLQVNARESGDTPADHVFVARVRKEVLQRSTFGAVVTDRRDKRGSNRVVGADARFVLKEHLTIMGLLASSSDSKVDGARWAGQLGATWQSDLIVAEANYVSIADGFTPAVGYVRRHDRMAGARVALRPRPGWRYVRQFEVTPSAFAYHDHAGIPQSSEFGVSFATLLESGDRLFAKFDTQSEFLTDPFDINRGVVLAPGRYKWTSGEVSFQTFDGRKVSGSAEANIGHFYTGRQGSYEFGLGYRPGRHFSVEAAYEFNDVDLREGSFQTHLLGVKSNVSFTNSLLASAYVQYNNTGSLAALQFRLNYIFRTIDNFYLVYNETRYTSGPLADRSNRSLVAKMTYSVHR
ncbi:MAG: DUF5916 domain-containing protein [Acidobacteriota bacterium]